jgi:hypothetical protein
VCILVHHFLVCSALYLDGNSHRSSFPLPTSATMLSQLGLHKYVGTCALFCLNAQNLCMYVCITYVHHIRRYACMYKFMYVHTYVFVRISLFMFVCLIPQTRQWAFVLLQRFAELLGKDEVTRKLVSTRWQCWTMFSGIDCCREAWAFIEKAADDLWGVKVGLQWHFMVECDKTCQKFLSARYGSDRCLFPDALKLASNAPSGPKSTWNPKRLQIAERSTCLTHDDGNGIGCKVTVEPDRSFGVLGAPCILFSRFWNMYLGMNDRMTKITHVRMYAIVFVQLLIVYFMLCMYGMCLARHLQVW